MSRASSSSTSPPPASIRFRAPAVWEMLRKVKAERDLTVLLTTHYMDEADKLCDRIAIVDHGELKALDSPLRLKASIPGNNTLDVSFGSAPPEWTATLRELPGVDAVSGADQLFRISTRNGPATTLALMEAAARAQVTVASLSVQSTSLGRREAEERTVALRRLGGKDQEVLALDAAVNTIVAEARSPLGNLVPESPF